MLHAKYLYKAALLLCLLFFVAAEKGGLRLGMTTPELATTLSSYNIILYLVLVYMRRHDIVANRLTGYLNIRSWLNRSRYCLSNIYNSELGSGGGRLGSHR